MNIIMINKQLFFGKNTKEVKECSDLLIGTFQSLIKLDGSTGISVENPYFRDMETNKKLEIKEVLDNVLLPLDGAWCISSVRTDDESGEIFLHLEYKLDYVEVEGVRYPIYDCDYWQGNRFSRQP